MLWVVKVKSPVVFAGIFLSVMLSTLSIFSTGSPHGDSDIDLMIILDNNHVSKTYQERLNKKIFIRNLVLEINRKIPLDILVYSKEELSLIKKHRNYFIDEIEKTGKIIYEKAS
jgi:predicted nucleotidyltransferase